MCVKDCVLGIVIGTVIFLIIVAIFNAEKFTIRNTVSMRDAATDYEFKVHKAHIDRREAAKTMAKLHQNVVRFLDYLKRNQVSYRGTELYSASKRLLKKYNPDNLIENSPYDPAGDTSYTINKGDVVALCLRDKSGNIHDTNLLMFVTIHELAHIAINDIGHPPRFWFVFKLLLREAISAGVYVFEDYSKSPKNYCGMDITSNPVA